MWRWLGDCGSCLRGGWGRRGIQAYEVRQLENGNTRTMIFSHEFIVSYLSQFMSLHGGCDLDWDAAWGCVGADAASVSGGG